MPGTRHSARLSGSGPELKGLEENPELASGRKRKASNTSSPPAKQLKKDAKEDKEVEDTATGNDGGAVKEVEMKEAPKAETEVKDEPKEQEKDETRTSEEEKPEAKTEEPQGKAEEPKEDAPEAEGKEENGGHQEEQASDSKEQAADSGKAVEESSQRAKAVPSTILEKGIIYFFMRGRVGIEDPESVGDLQRTYFVLRPLPKGAKLNEGPLEDSNNNRLFALPKKTFPKSHSDRFMAFVEKGKTTVQNLKDTFFRGDVHETKTQGDRVVPPVTPVGEGVYAITHLERTSHLVYALTIPSEPNEVQKDLGLHSKGSFILSVKNPERPGPASARLPKGPELPKEILEEFHGLAWAPAKPNYLDYDNVQILLIGEGKDDDLGSAVEQARKDEKQDKETPLEEIEKLEHEDELRVKHLHGDDSVYDDLHISKQEYPEVPTTW